MNCSSVIPGLTRKKQLVIVVLGLKENVSPCGTFETLRHSQELADVVAPIIKKRTIRRRTKKWVTNGENKAKNDAKGKDRVYSSNNSDTRLST
jgi:hypothetical protein